MPDPRLDVFCSDEFVEVFHPVAHLADVFRSDPLDVRDVHLEAREAFERLVHIGTNEMASAGRILLIKGESGSGKTHLMRAFRNFVHGFDYGFCAYMQMTTLAKRYDRYMLQKVIESLDRPHLPPAKSNSSLKHLSNGLAGLLPVDKLEHLRAAESGQAVRDLVNELTDHVFDQLNLSQSDSDIIRALLYLQVDLASVRTKVTKYLRMESLSDYERSVLGDMAARSLDDDALDVVSRLSEISREVLGRVLVVCVDQLEDMAHQHDAGARFRQAMDAVKQVAEIPGTVVVVACHEVFYADLRKQLTEAVTNRLELDPAPVTLAARRKPEEAEAVIALRLEYLFESANVEMDGEKPLFPLSKQIVRDFQSATTRLLLEDVRAYRMRAHELKKLPSKWPEEGKTIVDPPPPGPTKLAQAWNDFLTEESIKVPDEEEARARILKTELDACGLELGFAGAFASRAMPQPSWFGLAYDEGLRQEKDLLVALCEKSARGGGLMRQLEAVLAAADGQAWPVVVRSTDFPKSTSEAGKRIGTLIAKGGRRTVVQDTDWRTMIALQAFRKKHAGPDFDAFIRAERPITSLESIRDVLELDALAIPKLPKPPIVEVEKRPTPPQQRPTPPEAMPASAGALRLGRAMSRNPIDVTLEVEKLKRHMAFIGGTGSGKTTAALAIVENLLARGIPAILV